MFVVHWQVQTTWLQFQVEQFGSSLAIATVTVKIMPRRIFGLNRCLCTVSYYQTRNTFSGTWYLPHSRVHKSMAELCSNFGDSAITKGQIAYFYCTCAKRPYFYFRLKIWRHHCVPWPRFAIWFRNFGDSATSKGQIAYLFYCACAKRSYFYFRSNLWRYHRVPWPDLL